jgi:hypothetical protein
MEALRASSMQMSLDDNAPTFGLVYQQWQPYREQLVSPEYGVEFFKRKHTKFEFFNQNYLLDETVIRELNRIYDQIIPAAPGAK